MMDRTLVVVKPDGVRRDLTQEILHRFEAQGFTIVSIKNFHFTKRQAKEFYSPHAGKRFFDDLVSFITSGPVVAVVLQAPKAIEKAREIIGPTDPAYAPKGTIRGDYGTEITMNIIHAADSSESFLRESKVIFG